MIFTINKTEAEVCDGETLPETSRRAGHNVPSLCYAKGAIHQSSCMVCSVRDVNAGQIIPSCTTHPTEGMEIETDSVYRQKNTIQNNNIKMKINNIQSKIIN